MKKFKLKWVLLFALSLSFPSLLPQLNLKAEEEKVQQEQMDLTLSAATDKVKVVSGESLTFTVTIVKKKSLSLTIPEFGAKIEGFRIVQFGEKGPFLEEDRETIVKWFEVKADISGTYILPAISLPYLDPNSGEKKVATTSEIFVEVEAKAGDDKDLSQNDIRDIRDLSLSSRSYRLPLVLAAIILIVLIVAGLIISRKKKKIKASEIIIPPHEWATNELEKLEKNTEDLQNNHKIFHFTLSNIIRNYLEKVYSFPATDMTFEELKIGIYKIENQQFKEQLKSDFLKLMEKTDFVKFTDFSISREESLSLLNIAKKLIEETKPQQAAPEERVI